MQLEAAVEVLVCGLCKARSAVDPYVPERIDGIWFMRDGTRRKVPRKIEVVTTGLEAGAVAARIRRQDLGRHFICEVHSPDQDFHAIGAAYKAAGYRALSSEGFFHHDMSHIPAFLCEPPVREVFTQAEADTIPRVPRYRHRVWQDLRCFVVWDQTRDYGSVMSVPVGDAAWVANLWVHRDMRRTGYGRALMSSMLQADKASGIKDSVLAASSDGARLYPHLGYRQIGVLQVFSPIERR